MEERLRFIDLYLSDEFSMTELCQLSGISRRVGYKWLARYDAEGRAGLQDRSRAPRRCPHRIKPEVAELLCGARRKHPDWGPKKLLNYLAARRPTICDWPAISTAADCLARAGLVKARRGRSRPPHPGAEPIVTAAPNDLWTADFKGQFRTGDGVYCYPLTVMDLHSRFLLECQGLASTRSRSTRTVFERLFREYGLPRAIRTDNGVPFATVGLRGLSALNVWWCRLGIHHQRIQPASPQQNGAHERMHKTLKRGAIRPPRKTRRAQQRAFNRFRQSFNSERPHDALGGETPSTRFTPSPRSYPETLPPVEYPGHYQVRRVTTAGTFQFQHQMRFLSRALIGQPIGLDETDDGVWSIYFCQLLLARFDERTNRIIRP